MGALFLFLLLLVFPSPLLACGSNCYLCHQIPKDKEHEVISTCSKCHKSYLENSKEKACGADCFDCHNYGEVMKASPAHRVLKRCLKCHTSIKKKSIPAPLRELLGGY
ncbi:hypothetical protein [Thermovibrio sp.]